MKRRERRGRRSEARTPWPGLAAEAHQSRPGVDHFVLYLHTSARSARRCAAARRGPGRRRIDSVRRAAALLAVLLLPVLAEGDPQTSSPTSDAKAVPRAYRFAVTGYLFGDQSDYVQPTVDVDHGPRGGAIQLRGTAYRISLARLQPRVGRGAHVFRDAHVGGNLGRLQRHRYGTGVGPSVRSFRALLRRRTRFRRFGGFPELLLRLVGAERAALGMATARTGASEDARAPVAASAAMGALRGTHGAEPECGRLLVQSWENWVTRSREAACLHSHGFVCSMGDSVTMAPAGRERR